MLRARAIPGLGSIVVLVRVKLHAPMMPSYSVLFWRCCLDLVECNVADIVLINPKFDISFWGFEHALPFFGKSSNMPVAALPLLAALTPPEHQVTLIDENVEEIDFQRCARADIVGVTGMVVQRHRMREILSQLKSRGVYTVVGGPWITVNEEYFSDVSDVSFIGEAEETWPQFLKDWHDGKPAERYEQADKTDMHCVPVPRLDLLRSDRYAFGSVQFSRGCPFQCEFCDIIVVFGRRPRLKSAGQIVAELEALRRQNLLNVFIVDDNLIGNKKAIKEILKEVIEWQRTNGFPLTFVAEASIDLADDSELMQLMAEANIGAVFVGIESTNEESLRETRKFQNLRGDDGLLEKARRIQAAGLEVWGGMIVGFDHDDRTIFDTQRRFLSEARISLAMIGMLSAIPKTPLYVRLKGASRLDPEDDSPFGTNVLPLQMTREALSSGYVQLMVDLYDPESYFDRLDDLYINERIDIDRACRRYGMDHPWWRLVRNLRYWIESSVLMARLLRGVSEQSLRRIYRRRFWRAVRVRHDAPVLRVYAIKCAVHYHMHRLVEVLKRQDRPVINTY
jgi:radical SAM superfamily enzyme YgiQ (UPF0313 family)